MVSLRGGSEAWWRCVAALCATMAGTIKLTEESMYGWLFFHTWKNGPETLSQLHLCHNVSRLLVLIRRSMWFVESRVTP